MSIAALRRIQIGIESVRGTSVAATKRILGGTLRMTPTLALYMPEDEERNSLASLHRRTITGQRAALVYEGSVTFEQVINFLSMALKGNITPSTPMGGTNAREWLFDPSLTASNAQDSFTFEYGDDQQEYESAFCMVEQLEFTLALNDVWKMTATMFGQFPAKSTFTGSLAAPTVEDVVGAKTKLYIDTSWAGLGGTEVSDTLVSAVIRFPTGLATTKYADGSLDFSGFSEGKRAAEVELVFKHNSSGEAEYDKYVSGGLNFVRIETEGAIIEDTTTKLLRFDLSLRYTEAPQFFEEANGETTIRLKGKTFLDPTSGSDFEVMVRNAVTAINGAT